MLFERQRRATDRQLRQFAAALTAFVLVVLLRSWWRHGVIGVPAVTLSSIALAIGALGIVAPGRIRWLFSTITTVTLPIGLVVSELMLAVLYFVVITPMAFALRAAGRDPLDRAIDREAPTYWVQHRDDGDPSRYFRQS